MDALNDLLKSFVTQSHKILGDNLIGIYLHGSAVMRCYNEKKSDIDLLVVVNEAIPNNIKHRFMDMVVELNTYAPPKGIELSIVKRGVCNPFVYPTPFELHFSIAHLEWYKTNPLDYIDKMKIWQLILLLFITGENVFMETISRMSLEQLVKKTTLIAFGVILRKLKRK